jgi:hypothetical protein
LKCKSNCDKIKSIEGNIMIAPIKAPEAIFPVSKINNTTQVKKSNDPVLSEVVEAAKDLLYQNNSLQLNQKALDLVLLAETALDNGNPYAAQDFADRAIEFISEEDEVKQKKAAPEKININKPENNDKKNNFHENNQINNKQKSISHIYKDVSNDAGVSFSYASPLTGPESFFAVPSHEGEHVARRVAEAMLKGDQIMVFVSYDIRYEPETGQPYMAGGETWAVTFSPLKSNDETNTGKLIDTFA